MKVLVTGAQGQVGSELIRQGSLLGIDIIASNRLQLDISRRESVYRFFDSQRPNIVINAAAYTSVDRAESEPELAFFLNRDGVVNLAQACAKNGIPLIHLSTDYVFDGSKEGAYLEIDTPNPKSVYGSSKLAGDLYIEAILQQFIILRVSWVFSSKGNNFVKTMLRLGSERDVLRIVSDQRGGPTWAGAIANTLLNLVKRWNDGEIISWGIYNYSGQPATTWLAFAETIFERSVGLGIIGSKPLIEPISSAEYLTPAKRPINSELNCHKIYQNLGIKQPDWRMGLESVIMAQI